MPPAQLPDATALVASLLSLMTKFSSLGCPRQAQLIRRELALLQQYPDAQVAPLMKQIGQRLEYEWAQLYFAIADDPVSEHQGIQGLVH